MTTPNTSVSNSVFCRKKGRKRGKCRDSRNSRRTTPAPTAEEPVPAPAPAPAATLEKSMSDHTPRTAKKSTDNFGRPASTNSDFSYGLYLNLD